MDLFEFLQSARVDEVELHTLLMRRFGHVTVSELDIRFYNSDNSALRLIYTRSGNLRLVEIEGLSPPQIVELRDTIQRDIVQEVGSHFHRSIAFFSQRPVGFFRFRDKLQIVEVPPYAPTIPYAAGSHPCLFEMTFPGSYNREIQLIRAERTRRKLENTMALLIPSFLRVQGSGGSKAWVFGEIVDGDITSEWRQLGYNFAGLGHLPPNFSDTGCLPTMDAMEPEQLYGRLIGFYPSENAIIPANLCKLLDSIEALPSSERSQLERACHWYAAARRVADESASGSFVALVSAIEALLPSSSSPACPECGKPTGPGPTALFRDFLEAHAPDSDVRAISARKQLYAVRSSLAHGSRLLLSDEVSFMMSKRGFEEGNQTYYLYHIVRSAILNWLLTQSHTA